MGAPVLGMVETEEVMETDRGGSSCGTRRVEVVYPNATRGEVGLLAETLRRDGAAADRLADFHGPTARAIRPFRAFELYGHEPVLGTNRARIGRSRAAPVGARFKRGLPQKKAPLWHQTPERFSCCRRTHSGTCWRQA